MWISHGWIICHFWSFSIKLHCTIESGYEAHAPITLSGKKYALNKVYVLNKQVSNYVVLPLFSNNTSIVTFVLTDYGFMLPCMGFVHLALLHHSTPADCAKSGQSVAWCWRATYKVVIMILSSQKLCFGTLSSLWYRLHNHNICI